MNTRLFKNVATILLLSAMIGFAFSAGLATVRDLRWPYDVDLLRDIGSAQAMLEGRIGSDPLFLDEKVWYELALAKVVTPPTT